MFDTTCARCGGCKTGQKIQMEPCARQPRSRTGVIVWEEHCVECGQPYCFKTCEMYERSFDGKCRRFKNGIVPVKDGYICEFKKWGKLEGVFTGRVWSCGSQRWFSVLDRFLSAVARAINRLMSFVPGRIGAITVFRRLKKWFFEYGPGNKDCQVNCLQVLVWADREVRLHLSVVVEERDIFDESIALKTGWNDFEIALPSVGRGARIFLFSTEEDEFALCFNRLDLVFRSSSASVAAPVPASESGSAKFVKCVAWDLDNTLWKGILVEDGIEKLEINEEAVRLIKELDGRGIVHTILSKNDYEPALKAMEKFGLDEYFVFPHINWLPKSGNLQAAAKEINIGLDAFAFVDDSAFERGEVGEKCPTVRVFNAAEIGGLSGRPEFNPPISAESAGRRLSYRREMQRVAAASTFQGDYDEFLRSCKIELTMFDLHVAEADEYRRCYELIQRTNQLTLAGRRYSEGEFRALVAKAGMRAYGIRCSDRFGDYGIVGAILYSMSGDVAKVEEFVMSCRVAKKKCEERTLRQVAQEAKDLGAKELVAEVVETGRNMALVSAFGEIAGMTCERKDDWLQFRLAVR